MKKKISLREAVIDAVKTNGPLKPKAIIAKVKRPANQVYTTLYKLFKENTLDKTMEGEYIFLGIPEELKPAPKKESAADTKLARAYAEIDNLQRQVHDLTIKYLDTTAVLKYLESKLNLSVK